MLPLGRPIARHFCLFATMLGYGPASHAIGLSGDPEQSLTVGTAYYFKPQVTNAGSGHVEFAVKNLPGWAKLARGSGVITGTPSQTGVWKDIVVEVWDGAQYGEMTPFTISVGPAATARLLQISGTPDGTAEVGRYYRFSPTVIAAGGSTPTYAIANKPSWAAFNAATGLLSGVPAVANVGATQNVTISVSNGSTRAALPSFKLAVIQPPASAVASLKWSEPTQNSDGTALKNLAGYVIRYGNSLNSLDREIAIPHAGTTEAVIDSLASGTWYFEVAAVNTAGVRGSFTTLVSANL